MTIEPAKMNWWYESVSDWLLQNPDKTLKDAALEFKVTPSWIYVLTKSRPFIEYHEARRTQHNLLVSVGVIDKAGAIADMALDHLAQKMVDVGDTLPVKALTEVADTMLARIGYGGGSRGASPIQAPAVNVIVDVNLINAAREAHQNRLVHMAPPKPPPDLSRLVEGADDDNAPLLVIEAADATDHPK